MEKTSNLENDLPLINFLVELIDMGENLSTQVGFGETVEEQLSKQMISGIEDTPYIEIKNLKFNTDEGIMWLFYKKETIRISDTKTKEFYVVRHLKLDNKLYPFCPEYFPDKTIIVQ